MAADVPRDRLSGLPDALLVSILSLIPLDEAARCTVLASRWRHLFCSTLLFDFNADMSGRRNVFKAVNCILAAHPAAPIRTFYTSQCFHSVWFLKLARRGVEKIDLNLQYRDCARRLKIPPYLFSCTSLTSLAARCCIFPAASKIAAGAPRLARLTEIDLWECTISDTALAVLISHCPVLERLRMENMGKLGQVHIRSPSLKVFHSDGEFDDLFIEYAPNLERLYGEYMYMRRGSEGGVRLEIVHAPKLEFLGYLAMNFESIEIGKDTILTMDEVQVNTLMPSLKTLAIEVSHTEKGYIGWITQLLELFPCLESLYIRSSTWSVIQEAAPESWDVLWYVPCVDNHLQKVVFEAYRGHEWQREMAKFLHGRSMFLEAMEFHCMEETNTRGGPFKVPSEKWVREQQKLLSLDSRASKDARFLFFKHQLVCNHHDLAHNEWYKRKYYDDLYEV